MSLYLRSRSIWLQITEVLAEFHESQKMSTSGRKHGIQGIIQKRSKNSLLVLKAAEVTKFIIQETCALHFEWFAV